MLSRIAIRSAPLAGRMPASVALAASASIRVSARTPLANGTLVRGSGLLGRRTLFGRRPGVSRSLNERLDYARITHDQYKSFQRRQAFLLSGIVSGVLMIIYLTYRIIVIVNRPIEADATGTPSGLSSIDQNRKVVVHDADGREIVPTNNSTVPHFPRTLSLALNSKDQQAEEGSVAAIAAAAAAAAAGASGKGDALGTEYTLVGLGTRTVSFLSIQVYVVGFYVATADIAALQSRLVKRVDPIATALVPSEKAELKAALLDPAQSEALWDELLASGVPARSLFRIVPVRDTDFPHLRDGFVRAIQARSGRILDAEAKQAEAKQGEATAEATGAEPAGPDFGLSVKEFRRAFNRGKAPKQHELLMVRDADGTLRVVFDDGRSTGRQELGSVSDERVSRALWLNYLGGRKVASEATRQSIVDGVLEFVERPIGTVATQVV